MKIPKQIAAPVIRPDGSCTQCGSGHQCAFHSQEGLRRDREMGATLRRVCASYKANEIARICATHEIESDEFFTREEKAAQFAC